MPPDATDVVVVTSNDPPPVSCSTDPLLLTDKRTELVNVSGTDTFAPPVIALLLDVCVAASDTACEAAIDTVPLCISMQGLKIQHLEVAMLGNKFQTSRI